MTLKLTKANLLRLKEGLFRFIHTNPLLSAILLVLIIIVVAGIVVKYVKSV